MADQESLVQNFKSITNQNDIQSRFYLESSNWDLTLALSSFYDNGGDFGEASDVPPQPPASSHSASSQDTEFKDSEEDLADTGDKKSNASGSSSRFHSLADYSRSTDKKDDEEGQEFYAGGSESSGEVILGPGKKKTGEDIVKLMFESAKKHGAMEVDPSSASSSTKKQGPSYFTGGGYKLGQKEDDHQFVAGAEKPRENRQLDVVLKLWKNGFTINDGDLRQYHDEENRKFLGTIGKGEIPQELIRMAHGGEVNLDMEDHKQEEYKPQKKKMKPFTGEGHMLGSAVPEVTSRPTPSKPAETSSVDPEVVVDESSPTTTVRLQLGDGSRVTQKFNHHHSVAELYSFVRDRNPGNTRNFVLMTTFPNKELKEDSTTLKAGNLLNAVIVQRFK